jgi:hypothetical protein
MFALGGFVGGILCQGLKFFGTRDDYIKVSGVILVSALSGTVITFIERFRKHGLDKGLYTYPLGLLMAVLWFFIPDAAANMKSTDVGSNVIGWSHALGVVVGTCIAGWLVLRPAFADVNRYATAAVQEYHVNGYHLRVDGMVNCLTAETNNTVITRAPEAVHIDDGRLKVGDKDYGKVQAPAHISILRSTVSINGVEAKPVEKRTKKTGK